MLTPELLPEPDDTFELITRDGLACWLHLQSGRILPVVAGGDGDDDPDDDETGDDPDDDEVDDDDPKAAARAARVKREQRIAKRERAKGERQAKRQFDAWLAEQKGEADKNDLDEVGRAKAELEAEKAQLARDKQEAARERLEAKAERALSRAGLDEKATARAVRLLDLEDDADADDIAEAVDALRDDMPALFGSVDDDADEPAAPGTRPGVKPAKPPKGGQKIQTAMEKGIEEARRRHPKPEASAAA